MRPFISLLIIVCLPMMFFSVYGSEAAKRPIQEKVLPSSSNYCNARFDFCVRYPAAILPVQEVSVNDDGVNLKTADGKSEISINGSFNVMNWSPIELLEFSLNSITDDKGGADISTSEFGDNYYECSFTYDGISYFNRSVFVKDYYISLLIKVPVNEPLLMQKLQSEVSFTHGGNPG